MSRLALRVTARAVSCLCLLLVAAEPNRAQTRTGADDESTVVYRVSVPSPQHRWLQVEVVFPGLGFEPLQARMSSASPGRYARHEFAKNIIDVHAFGRDGRALVIERSGAEVWKIAGHDGTVRLRYRLFGDRVDGTYLGVDSTHAHMNMPATMMWADGLEDRPVRVTFDPPAGARWRVATQLVPTAESMVFTAANLQYLMDSPTELSDFDLRTFTVSDREDGGPGPTFRVAIHHDSAPESVEPFVASVEAIVREMVTVFGEFPSFDTGTYTFIADYLRAASGDAMEHRNSTFLTAAGRIDTPDQRVGLLQSAAHEFFHAWNVERLRPRSLEPFDFTDANVSGDLWFAEGFTNYYGKLVMLRAGVANLDRTLSAFGGALNTVISRPGRRLNSATEMSRMAPFVDAATAIDRTNFGNTFVSYYTWGEVIALALDLTLRDRSDGAITLDDYMRMLWVRFGRAASPRPGYVERPYSPADLRAILAEVAGSRDFADDFFDRYIEGREVAHDRRLFARAGLILERVTPGRPSLGVDSRSGPLMAEGVPYGSALYEAGVARADTLKILNGQTIRSAADIAGILADKSPGERLPLVFERRGELLETTVTLQEDQRVGLRTLESTGVEPSPAQLAFREAWLGTQQ